MSDVRRIARPGDADAFASCGAQALGPAPPVLVGRSQIAPFGGKGFQGVAQGDGQGAQRRLQVMGRQLALKQDDLRGARQVGEQAHQLRLSGEHHPRAQGGQARQVAAELQGIARALVVIDQQGAARQVALAEP